MNNVSNSTAEHEAQQARNRLVEEHLPLVKFLVRRYARWRTAGLDREDLIQEGYLGLIHAAEQYDPEKINPETGKPYQFSTYATWNIRGRILSTLASKARTIYLPEHIWRDVLHLQRIQDDFWLQQQREPSVAELAEAMQRTSEQVTRLLEIRELKSLDEPLVSPTDDAKNLGELLEAPDPLPVEREVQAEVTDLLRYLYPEERQVIVCRYQLDASQSASADTHEPLPLPYIEVARRLQMSRERVQSVEKRALMKMRYWAERPYRGKQEE